MGGKCPSTFNLNGWYLCVSGECDDKIRHNYSKAHLPTIILHTTWKCSFEVTGSCLSHVREQTLVVEELVVVWEQIWLAPTHDVVAPPHSPGLARLWPHTLPTRCAGCSTACPDLCSPQTEVVVGMWPPCSHHSVQKTRYFLLKLNWNNFLKNYQCWSALLTKHVNWQSLKCPS